MAALLGVRGGGCPGPARAVPLEARRAGGVEAAAVASPAPSYLRRESLPAPSVALAAGQTTPAAPCFT